MSPNEEFDWPAYLARGVDDFRLLWDVVGNDLPSHVDNAFMGELDRLGDPREREEATNRRVERLLSVRDGLLAAHYHRDRIEGVEREVIARIRSNYPEGSRPDGSTISARMPVIAHEYIAYLIAARRTLDYLARGVSSCFERTIYSIKSLATGLADAKPQEPATNVISACQDIFIRFADLLTEPQGQKSERDTAAHYAPIEPASVSVVFFPNGRVGIYLQDGGAGHLPGIGDRLDPELMKGDDLQLTASVSSRLSTLDSFCVELVGFAVDAELDRIASRPAE